MLLISHNLGVDPQDVRPGRRDVRRRDRRGGRRRAGLRRAAAPVHGRAAALHPARRASQGPTGARHDPGLPARSSGRSCRRACSSTAARLAQDVCRTTEPRVRDSSATATTARCHFHEMAESLPRATDERAALTVVDRDAEPSAADRPTWRRRSRRTATTYTRWSDVSAILARGRDARPRRRVRLRQDDARATLLGIVESDAGRGRARRRQLAADAAKRDRGRRRGHPDGVPEPGLGAQPASHGAAHPQPLAQEADRPQGRGGRRPLGASWSPRCDCRRER